MPCRDENGGFGELIRAVERSASPIILTEPRSPFRIVYVNESWTRTCGYSLQQTIGWTAAILQGPGTCKTTLALLGEAIRNGKSIRVELLNFTMHGRAFVNQLSISPIVDDSSGGIYLYKGVMRDKFEMLASPVGSMMLRPKRPPDIGFSSLLGAVAAPFFSRPSPLASGAAADAVGMRLTMTESVGAAIPWLGAPTAAAHARQDTCPQRRVPKFLTKLYALLSDKRFSHLASWSDDGLCICVHQPSVFAEVVLPCFYKHNRFSSFQQQLNIYSFKRTGLPHSTATISWQNPLFRRDRAELIAQIRPKQALTVRSEPPREDPSANLNGFFLDGFAAAATKAAQSGDEDDAPREHDDCTSEQEARKALLEELRNAAVECRQTLGAMVDFARGARNSQLGLNACLVALGGGDDDDGDEEDGS